MPSKIPVYVLTGFLGSGKTTLLNRLLADGVKTAVIVNEFGSEPIDQTLIQAQDLPMTVLAGGCLCCQVQGALAPTLKNLWMTWQNAATKPFARIIIETSGIANPAPILDTLLRDRWLMQRYRLQRIVATLAIPSAARLLSDYAEARAQAVWADQLWLTHDDVADDDQRMTLRDLLQQLTPVTPLLSAAATAPGELTTASPPLVRRMPDQPPIETHPFVSLSGYWSQVLDWNDLQQLLQQLLADPQAGLIRGKGVLLLAGYAESQVVQIANNQIYPLTSLALSMAQPASRLVLIGGTGLPNAVAKHCRTMRSELLHVAWRVHQ